MAQPDTKHQYTPDERGRREEARNARLHVLNAQLLAALEGIMASMRNRDGTTREGYAWVNSDEAVEAFAQGRTAIKAARREPPHV